MAKANNVATYTVSKDDKGYHLQLTEDFRQSALKAAAELGAVLVNVVPVAVNLWTAYKKVVVTDAVMGRLNFFAAFDQTIPTSYGKPGSTDRKALDTHKVYNRLCYLTFKVGKAASGDGLKKRDPKVAKAEAKTLQTNFGKWAKQYKLSAAAIKFLIMNILKLKDKAGKMSKKGSGFMKAAGIAVAEE